MKKYYVAYGSNLNLEQMYKRCPDSKLIGTGKLNNYALKFRGLKVGAVATVEPQQGSRVPVGVFEISDNDEVILDRYEGYPRLYTKDYFQMNVKGNEVTAMIYVIDPKLNFGIPSDKYFETIKQGYEDCGFDENFLEESVEDMKNEMESQGMTFNMK